MSCSPPCPVKLRVWTIYLFSKAVASGLDISVQAYGKIENGGTDLNISRLFEIAKFFDVSFTQVLKINEGDIFNYSSQNNTGGYHVLNNGVLNTTDETLKTYFENGIPLLYSHFLIFSSQSSVTLNSSIFYKA